MTPERISIQDISDFQEGKDGPAAVLYSQWFNKLTELIDSDLKCIFIADLIQHAKGEAISSMATTYQTFAAIQRVVMERVAELESLLEKEFEH